MTLISIGGVCKSLAQLGQPWLNQRMKNTVRAVAISLVVLAVIAGVILNYSFLFSKKVIGPIVEIDRVAPQDMILNSRQPDPLLVHTFAIAIKDQSGDIFTASTTDERWAIARRGFCVEARFWPYPPWDFARFGTYQNAQLLQLRDCKSMNLPDLISAAMPVATPAAPSAPTAGVTPAAAAAIAH